MYDAPPPPFSRPAAVIPLIPDNEHGGEQENDPKGCAQDNAQGGGAGVAASTVRKIYLKMEANEENITVKIWLSGKYTLKRFDYHGNIPEKID